MNKMDVTNKFHMGAKTYDNLLHFPFSKFYMIEESHDYQDIIKWLLRG